MTRRLLLAVVATLALCSPASPAVAADPGPYVALGDSYTAAPLVPNQVGMPLGCARSDHNYPSLVARALAVSAFTDVSCSSATTAHMTAPQSVLLGTNAPQFDALRAATRLVTVGIGGNDVGLVGAAVTCAQLGLTAPTGTACRSHFTDADGTDRLSAQIAATAPKIAAVLQGIQRRSPLARVVLVGYPDVLPRTGNGCWPVVPLSPDDVRYFDGLIVQTNGMLAGQAAAAGVEFADTYSDSIGHDVCTLPGTRWFEGVVPTAPAYPLHPNGLGMKSMSNTLVRILGAQRRTLRGRATPGKTAIARTVRSSARSNARR